MWVELVRTAVPVPPLSAPTSPLRRRSSSPVVNSEPPDLVSVSEPPSDALRIESVPVEAVIVALPAPEVSESATSAAVPRLSVVAKPTLLSCAA